MLSLRFVKSVSTAGERATFSLKFSFRPSLSNGIRSNGFKLLLHPTQLGKSLVVPDLKISYVRDLEFSLESSAGRLMASEGLNDLRTWSTNSGKEGSR